jgi:hypothetical protein
MTPFESWVFALATITAACAVVVALARAITKPRQRSQAHPMTRLERAESEMKARRTR